MGKIQQKIQPVADQLRGLPTTAKLLIGALMVILVMALFLVAQYAGRSAMVRLPVPLTADTRPRVLSYLETAAIPYETRGNDVLVPPDQRYTVLAQLASHDVIAPDQIDFDSLIAQDSPFLSRAQHNKRWLVAKMNVLARMISQMDGIARATVVIGDPERSGGIGRARVRPTASVTVSTTGEELAQSKVDAIAQMVAGSHAGLEVEHVSIIDNRTGRARKANTAGSMAATQYLELRNTHESDIKQKILDILSYIPMVSAEVRVIVDNTYEEVQSRSYENPKSGVTREENELRTSTRRSSGGEPGILSNVGADFATAPGMESTMTEERNRSDFANVFPIKQSKTRDPKGHALLINATIGVPRSYFVAIYQQEQDDPAAQPNAVALGAIADREIAAIKAQVEPLIDTKAIEDAVPGTVMVRMIPDFALGGMGDAPETRSTFGGGFGPGGGGAGSGGGSLLEEGLRYLGLGALVLLSLAMMFLMVRKASAREELPSPQELVGTPPALKAAESDVVGEAQESSPPLEGVEIQEEALRRQQMLDQINEMVTRNSDEAASLLRRWIKTQG